MESKCKGIYHSSTLPPILETYQSTKIEDEDKRKKTHSPEMTADQEVQSRHQALLEQRHLEAYISMHRLRDALCRRYSALLKDKVNSQRQQLLHKHQANTMKPENETKTQRKLVYSLLQHNDSYLRSLPKTNHYLILDLQNKLTQQGHLKSQQDLKDFYMCIDYTQGPTQLQKSLQEIQKNVVCGRSATHLMTRQKVCKFPRSSILHEDRGVPLQSAIEGGSGPGEDVAELQEEEEPEGTERMFPKMKVPTFVTLQPKFTRSLQRKMPHVVIPAGIPEKNTKAEINLRRLRQMHDRSVANMAFSRRLLDRERHLLYWQEEPSIQDLMSLVFLSIDSKQEDPSQAARPLLPSVMQSRSITTNSDSPHSPQDLNTMTCPGHQTAFPYNIAHVSKAEPLSMEDVCQQKSVQIIDHGVKMWSNYTDDTD